MKTSTELKTAWIALVSLAFFIFLGKIHESPLRGAESNFNAAVSLSMTDPDQWLPKLPAPDPNPGARETVKNLNVKNFNDQPFPFYWLNGKVMRALGPSAWSASILTAFFSVGTVVLTGWLGSLLYSPLFGFFAAILLLFSRVFILPQAAVSLDPALMFFILLSLILWKKNRWLEMGLVTGLGLGFKSLIAFTAYPTVIVILAIQGKLKENLSRLIPSALIGISIGGSFSIFTGILGGWDLVKDYWIRQLLGAGSQSQWAPETAKYILGLPFLLVSLFLIFRKRKWSHPVVLTSGASIGMLILALTPTQVRMTSNYQALFPFLALLSSFSFTELFKRQEKQIYLSFSFLVLPLISFSLCTPTVRKSESLIALQKLIPIIQAYGDCDDELMLISSTEPEELNSETSLLLKFYTDRQIWIERCESATKTLRSNPPEWILVSSETLHRCFSPQDLSSYSYQIKIGQHVLLTDLIPSGNHVDLTPLERELKPVVNCKPQAYPKDIYHRNW